MTHRQRRGRRRGRLLLAVPFPLFLLAVCAAVTVGATALRALAAGGRAPQVLSGTAERLLAFLDYFAGVFTLLSLTAAVLCGLAATDRLVLTPRLRVAAQSVHRATSVAAVGFLATHIGVKVAERDASPLAALLPFGGGATFAVGLGTLAADLLVLAAATGAVRGRFADARRPGLWRVLHASAYACWPIALAHGLTAGRAAAVWVLWSYGACGALVALALLVRTLGLLDRRPHAPRLRAYRPRRPSRATLAELSTLSREHEPVPYAGHAPRTAGGVRFAGAGSGAAASTGGYGGGGWGLDAAAGVSPGHRAGARRGAAASTGGQAGAGWGLDAAAGVDGAHRAGGGRGAAAARGWGGAGYAAGYASPSGAGASAAERPREHPRLADTPPNGITVPGLPHATGRHGRRVAAGVHPSTPGGPAPHWHPAHGPSHPYGAPADQSHPEGPYVWAAGVGALPYGSVPDSVYVTAPAPGDYGYGYDPAQPGTDWGSGEWGPLTWDAPAAGGVGV